MISEQKRGGPGWGENAYYVVSAGRAPISVRLRVLDAFSTCSQADEENWAILRPTALGPQRLGTDSARNRMGLSNGTMGRGKVLWSPQVLVVIDY